MPFEIFVIPGLIAFIVGWVWGKKVNKPADQMSAGRGTPNAD